MAVSQDIQDIADQLAALPAQWRKALDAAVAAIATAKAEHDEMVAEMKQDHADELAALQAAINALAPPDAGTGPASAPAVAGDGSGQQL